MNLAIMKKIKLNDFENVLIIQTAFIGDVVLTLPLCKKIKELNKNIKLNFLTTNVSNEIPKLLKVIDNVIIYDKYIKDKGLKGLVKLIYQLKHNNYNIIITPHRSIRSALISYFSKPKYSISFNNSSLSFLYNYTINYEFKEHEIKRNLNLLSCFEEYDNLISFVNFNDLIFTEDTINNVNNISLKFELKYQEYILLAPGSIWNTKKWNIDYFIKLIKLLNTNNLKCVLIGGKNDKSICNYISNRVKCVDLSGITSISESILLINNSKLLITNDSAPIHFAGLTSTNVIAIFGPTIPEFGFSPIKKDDLIIQDNNLKCRPCTIHGGNKCPINNHKCMNNIKPEYVFEKIINYFRR